MCVRVHVRVSACACMPVCVLMRVCSCVRARVCFIDDSDFGGDFKNRFADDRSFFEKSRVSSLSLPAGSPINSELRNPAVSALCEMN